MCSRRNNRNAFFAAGSALAMAGSRSKLSEAPVMRPKPKCQVRPFPIGQRPTFRGYAHRHAATGNVRSRLRANRLNDVGPRASLSNGALSPLTGPDTRSEDFDLLQSAALGSAAPLQRLRRRGRHPRQGPCSSIGNPAPAIQRALRDPGQPFRRYDSRVATLSALPATDRSVRDRRCAYSGRARRELRGPRARSRPP